MRTRPTQPKKVRRDRKADPWPGDDLFPTVKWSPWLFVQLAGAVIAPWLLFGAVGFAVFWAMS